LLLLLLLLLLAYNWQRWTCDSLCHLLIF